MAEAWYTFPAQMGDHRAFLTFDYGFSEIVDTDSRNFLLKVRVGIKRPTEAGMPTNEEFPALTALDEALDQAVTTKGGVYVGRVTVKGYRHFFFYVNFDEKTADDLVAKVSEKSGYALDLSYAEDRAKGGYWNDLYPTVDDWQVIRDMDVLDALSKNGDSSEIEREVNHWSYFDDATAANNFAEWLREAGYTVSKVDCESSGKVKTRFSHTSAVTLEAITKHTIAVNRKVKEFGGQYDGWETSVEHTV